MAIWLIVSMLFGAVFLALSLWLRWHRIVVKWYDWLIAATGLVLLIFSLQNFWATKAEHWSFGTPLTFLLVFGLPGGILMILAGLLSWWRYFRKHSSNT